MNTPIAVFTLTDAELQQRAKYLSRYTVLDPKYCHVKLKVGQLFLRKKQVPTSRYLVNGKLRGEMRA